MYKIYWMIWEQVNQIQNNSQIKHPLYMQLIENIE